jgi:hypothetical protein
MPEIPLEDLNRQIQQRERELKALRQELESRRSQFTVLTRRKEELLSQLRQVESEIAALSAAPGERTKQAKAASSNASPPRTAAPGHPRLGEVILTALRESGKAMTARQLSEEARRRGFPLRGRNPVKSVESRLQEMKQKHLVQRASGQPGYIPTSSAHSAKAEKPKTTAPASKQNRKATAKPTKSALRAKTAQTDQHGKQSSLRQVLANILKNKSGRFLSGSELAQLVLSSGYKTKSTKFVDAVWSMLGQMDNVEHVKGKGYRLKKT